MIFASVQIKPLLNVETPPVQYQNLVHDRLLLNFNVLLQALKELTDLVALKRLVVPHLEAVQSPHQPVVSLEGRLVSSLYEAEVVGFVQNDALGLNFVN